MQPKKNSKKFELVEILILSASGILILFSLFAPRILISPSPLGIDFGKYGTIGDAIGGLMNPFIGIAGVLLTFLAFYIQYKANIQQRDLFRQELDSNKFENQFYEMLRLHKENVNEIYLNLESKYWSGKESYQSSDKINGREVFKYFLEEIKIIYYAVKKTLKVEDANKALNVSYHVLWNGIYANIPNIAEDQSTLLFNNLDQINRKDKNNKTVFVQGVEERSDYRPNSVLNYDLFQGHSAKLAHYYRHLFQTVKFITKQDSSLLTYEGKRNYLRILRSQLSNQEQAMLFYNWKAGYGGNWENDSNKFFTDYRMIHNLYDEVLIDDFKLSEIFKNNDYKKEKNRESDNLFESEDWQ